MTDNTTALKKAGLKVTLPRCKNSGSSSKQNGIRDAEDLYKRLIDMGEEIGLATVCSITLNRFAGDDAT